MAQQLTNGIQRQERGLRTQEPFFLQAPLVISSATYWSLELRKGQPDYDIIKDDAAINQWQFRGRTKAFARRSSFLPRSFWTYTCSSALARRASQWQIITTTVGPPTLDSQSASVDPCHRGAHYSPTKQSGPSVGPAD